MLRTQPLRSWYSKVKFRALHTRFVYTVTPCVPLNMLLYTTSISIKNTQNQKHLINDNTWGVKILFGKKIVYTIRWYVRDTRSHCVGLHKPGVQCSRLYRSRPTQTQKPVYLLQFQSDRSPCHNKSQRYLLKLHEFNVLKVSNPFKFNPRLKFHFFWRFIYFFANFPFTENVGTLNIRL